VAAGVLALAGLTISPSYAADDTEIYIVQGVPGKNLDVAIDGKSVLTVGTTGSKKPSEVNTGTGGQAVGAGPSSEVNLAR
jgi:hypothetical protein